MNLLSLTDGPGIACASVPEELLDSAAEEMVIKRSRPTGCQRILAELVASHKPTLLAVTESRLDATVHNDILNLTNYKLLCLNRSEMSYKSASSGGVMIYVMEQLDIVATWEETGDDFEVLGCILMAGRNKWAVVAGYRSPVPSNLDVFFSAVHNVIHKVTVGFSLCLLYVCGDFNINLLCRRHWR
jgi:hypothetical protein